MYLITNEHTAIHALRHRRDDVQEVGARCRVLNSADVDVARSPELQARAKIRECFPPVGLLVEAQHRLGLELLRPLNRDVLVGSGDDTKLTAAILAKPR